MGQLTALVPSSADSSYKAKEELTLGSVSFNGNPNPSTLLDNGVQVVAYFGDTSGDGTLGSLDSVLLTRVASTADSGFAAYPLVDPNLIADINGDGKINSQDGVFLGRAINDTAVPQIPPLPTTPLPITQGGPDPTVSIPTGLRVSASGTVIAPVNIDDPQPAGSTGMQQATLALTYDPSVLSVSASDVHLGSVPLSGSGWRLETVVDQATGQIGITIYSATPISSDLAGSLVTIDFHLIATAAVGNSSINLAASVNPNGQGVIQTAIDDDQGAYTLNPAPTNGYDAGVDGGVLLPAQLAAPADKANASAQDDSPQTATAVVEERSGSPAVAMSPELVNSSPRLAVSDEIAEQAVDAAAEDSAAAPLFSEATADVAAVHESRYAVAPNLLLFLAKLDQAPVFEASAAIQTGNSPSNGTLPLDKAGTSQADQVFLQSAHGPDGAGSHLLASSLSDMDFINALTSQSSSGWSESGYVALEQCKW